MKPGDRVKSITGDQFTGKIGTIRSQWSVEWHDSVVFTQPRFDVQIDNMGVFAFDENELEILPTPDEHSVDCRSADGITIGLIDGIIAMARVLADHNLDHDAVKAALEDLRSDEDMHFLMTGKIKE